MKFFKKGLILGLVIVLFFSSLNLSTLVASEKYSNLDDTVYEYDYEGIKFTGNVPLNDEQLESLYHQALSTTKDITLDTHGDDDTIDLNNNFNLMMIPGGGNGGTITHGPVYTKTDPAVLNAFVDAMIFWFTHKAKIANKVKKTTWGAYVLGKLSGWIPKFKSKPIGYWNWRVKDSYPTRGYYDYQTLAMYSDFTYKKITHVDYYRLN
ncbi:hypothetical protein [Amphibacillus sediminis]|uniref:hypothetical protein n=1 Tax=Amphibacillus sediminis TaxID=360185 RepID=UPI00082DD634|nr:hypothetical protein [Amphibacillus sediminis]